MNSQKLRFVPDAATGFLCDEDTKKYLSRFGWAVFAMSMATEIGAVLLVMLVKELLPNLLTTTLSTTIASHMVSFIAIYCLAMPIFLLTTRALPSVRPIKEKMGVKKTAIGFCISIAGMMAGSYISNLLLILINDVMGLKTENPIEEAISPQDPAMIAVTVIFMVILAPILEEIFFRRVLCDRLLPLGEGYAIVISAAVFGLFHGNFYQFAYGFIVGLFFALIYVKTGRLKYSILYHMGLNFMGSVLAPWIVSRIDLDRLEELLEPGKILFEDPMFVNYLIYSGYSMLMSAAAIVGIVFFFSAKSKGELRLYSGILPAPKKHRYLNFFCNAGVAAAIAFFVFSMLTSIMPEDFVIRLAEAIK